jgi:hypothetical protein
MVDADSRSAEKSPERGGLSLGLRIRKVAAGDFQGELSGILPIIEQACTTRVRGGLERLGRHVYHKCWTVLVICHC